MKYPRQPLLRTCDEVVVGHVGPSSGHRMDDGIPFLMGKNVGEGFLKLDDLERVTPAFHRAQRKSQLSPGDVVVVRIGRSGQAAKIPESLGEANCSGLVVIKHPRAVTADFLVHYLNSPEGRRQSTAETKGSTRQTLNTRSVAAAEIPVPSLSEQTRIAEVLDRAEALRAKRRAALAQLDTLTQSIFLDMFGDPEVNPKQWPAGTPLGDVSEIVSGITVGRQVNGQQVRPVRYLAVVNVQDKALDLSVAKTIEATDNEIRRFRLRADDLLLTEGGDPDKLGRGTLWKDEVPECIHQNHIFRVRLTSGEVDPLFLNWLVGSKRGKRYFLKSAKQTTGIASINMSQLRGFPLLIPPMALQCEFGRRIAGAEELKSAYRASLAESDALFSSLQHRAFAGQL
jgi:type I restriction enzyme, S subunit